VAWAWAVARAAAREEVGVAYLYIIAGAVLGAPLRYFVQGRVHDWAPAVLFPIGTLAVNLSACLLLGAVATIAEERGLLDRGARLAIITGFLGSYSTYSTYSYESVQLLRGGEFGQTAINIAATTVGGLAAVWLGIVLARRII
jgi:CrcB protein